MNTPAWQDRLKWQWSWCLGARLSPASELSLNQNNSQFSRTTTLSYSQGYRGNCSCTYKEIDFQLICMVARTCGKQTVHLIFQNVWLVKAAFQYSQYITYIPRSRYKTLTNLGRFQLLRACNVNVRKSLNLSNKHTFLHKTQCCPFIYLNNI